MKNPFRNLFKRSAPPAALPGRAFMFPPQTHPEYAQFTSELQGHNKRMSRAYDAAVVSNLNADLVPTVTSSNAEILTSLYIMRGNSRTLVKDYSTAKGMVRTFRNNVAGDDPFRLKMNVVKSKDKNGVVTLDTEINQKIQDAWKEAGKKKNCTCRKDMSRLEMYHMVIAAVITDGSVIARHVRDFPNNKFKYALQFFEADRLQESYTAISPRGNVIRFSIERDQWDSPVGYWLLTRHPGDLFQYNGMNANKFRKFYPAEEIIHFNNWRERAEQDIGVPEFNSCIQALHQDRQFDIAHKSAAIWSSAKPFWIVQDVPTGMSYVGDAPGNQGGLSYGGSGADLPTGQVETTGALGLAGGDGKGRGVNKYKDVSNATGEELPWGKKPVQLDTKFPIEAATSFKRDNMMLVASGAGLSYGSVSADYEKYSFSTARAAQVPERDNFKCYQQLMIENFVSEHFNVWLESSILSGTLDLPISRLEEFQNSAEFHAKRWPYIQPVQDAQADIELIEARLKSPQEVLMESEGGRDFKDVLAEIAEYEKTAEDMGVVLGEVTTPRLPKDEPGNIQSATPGAGGLSQKPARKRKKRFELNGHSLNGE